MHAPIFEKCPHFPFLLISNKRWNDWEQGKANVLIERLKHEKYGKLRT
jgi:hypothetical protein